MIAAILNSAILVSAILYTKKPWLIHSPSTWWWQPSWSLPSWIQPFCTKKTSLIHSDSNWWWQPSWILPFWIWPSWIQPSCTKKTSLIPSQTHSHLPRVVPNIYTRKLGQSDSNSFILTQLDDGSHLELLPCWIQTLPSWIQTHLSYLLSDSLTLAKSSSHSFTQENFIILTLTQTNFIQCLTQLDDGSHLELCHVGCFRPFCTKLWLKLGQSDSNSFILT